MSFCGKCGSEVPEGARFCMKCGRSVSENKPEDISSAVIGGAVAPAPEQTPVSEPAPVADEPVAAEQVPDVAQPGNPSPAEAPRQAKKSKAFIAGLIAAIAAFILVILIGVMIYNNAGNKEPVGTGDALTQMIEQAEMNTEYITE